MKKRMNRKGFTLVELLAVVVILLAISVIAVTSISAAIERANVKRDDASKKALYTVARTYFDDYKNTINSDCVDVSVLIDYYNIDSDSIKKSDGDVFDGSIKKNGNKYIYQENKCS